MSPQKMDDDVKATLEARRYSAIEDAKAADDSPVVSDEQVDEALEIVADILKRVDLPFPLSLFRDQLVDLLMVVLKPQDLSIG